MSPPPSSDDSAVESMVSASASDKQIKTQRRKVTRPSVNSEDLKLSALHMRSNNFCLLSRSTRTVLTCFDDLEIQRFESNNNYLVNFISNGINKNPSSLSRPVSILWPDSYEKLVEQISILDAHLMNINFREKPVNWMLDNGLTFVPNCRQCKDKMNLIYENNTVRWQCQKTPACSNYFMPIQRPTFFCSYEKVGLDKLLFSIYYWATCTPSEELYSLMKIEPTVLDSIWRRIQNVCRNMLEKKYPRLRLTNDLDQGTNSNGVPEPIDLISIKLNGVYIVCAKNPKSNLVRLGLYIPNVSLYTFGELTDTWFAHGSQVRISESKFLSLGRRRTDLRIQLVPRSQMVSRDDHFHRESAFGYIICQLSHILKDFDSSSLTCENLKLILAEIEWREIYGTNPYDAFTNIVNHLAEYGDSSDYYTEPSLPVEGEVTLDPACPAADASEYICAERYFYATVDPVDSEGKIICRFTEPPDLENPPPADVRIRCHECGLRLETFDFALHMIAHVERNRKEHERKEYLRRMIVECKHCFKMFPREQLILHSTLVRSHLHVVKFGCRICCVKLADRAQYLQHMRRLHFEHETPYRCPSCKFSSSFQRDVFIHFQEEHRHSMVIMCILCLRSFTVKNPEKMNLEKMSELSKIVYNHIAEHYVTSKGFTCSNCCLCFLNKDQLRSHKRLHHDPCEIRPDDVKLEPFIVTPEEEEFCVKGIPMEFFIANKRPNLSLNSNAKPTKDKTKRKTTKHDKPNESKGIDLSSSSSSDDDDDDESDDYAISAIKKTNRSKRDLSSEDSDDTESSSDDEPDEEANDNDSFFTAVEDGTIYVRGLNGVEKFLQDGRPALSIQTRFSKADSKVTCSSQKLIQYLSRMKQADGIVPNQSVILTPRGKPAKCCECFQFVTADHFVATIDCKSCKYVTHCPRAAIAHNTHRHSNVQ